MPTYQYTYNISDTLNNKVSPDSIKIEIETNVSITKALENPFPISVGETTFSIKFKEELSAPEESSLTTLVSQHTGADITNTIQEVKFSSDVPKTGDGRLRIANEKSNAEKDNKNSHDWCDKTTWYSDSVRVVDEVPTTSDYITYNLSHNYIIDTYHGKMINEERLKDVNGNSYRVVVKVNDVVKTEKDPHFDVSPTDPPGYVWDYVINYVAGTITFETTLSPSDEVKVTYFYATTSTFYIRPPVGKDLEIDYVECQFTEDIVLKDTILFEPYGYVDVFAPQMMGPPYNLPSGYKIPLGNRFVYKGMRDFLADSIRAYPPYEYLSPTAGWRGMNKKVQVFSWDYVRSTKLIGAYGMEIRIRLEKNVPFGGTYSSVTFYCGIE